MKKRGNREEMGKAIDGRHIHQQSKILICACSDCHQIHHKLQSRSSRRGQDCAYFPLVFLKEIKYPAPLLSPRLTPHSHSQQANFTGNGTKSMHTSVAASLKKLQTDYIDLLYVHWWDFSASIPELMQSLNHLVVQGKVLYLGVSDTPAWVVSKANQYARDHGLRQFCVYQGRWSAASRDFEREIIPMCRDEGVSALFQHVLFVNIGYHGS